MVITALCPHSLSFRPIVISSQSIVQIEPVSVNKGTTILFDGRTSEKLLKGDSIKIQRGKGSFLVINNPIRTQWDTLAGKLKWADKPKYNT